jgi:hypothetical protein
MKLVKIPKKKKGEFREICIPSHKEKEEFRKYLPSLNEKSNIVCNPHVVHGFVNKKSPVTNAKMHIGKKYTLKFDLSNFFDTVKPIHLKGKLTEEEITKLMPDGRAYQGLPTSPAIANIAAVDMDNAIIKKIKGKNIVYTRYADDLCFSFDDFEMVKFLKDIVPQIVGRCGFKINKQKTWLQDSRFGNRIITGVSVSSTGISATKSVRRKLRAAIHQKNKSSISGLTEWIKLKEPVLVPDPNKIIQDKLSKLCKTWKLKRIILRNIPRKLTEQLSDDVIISGDPVQILGLSNWATNWRSCMRHPEGQYHRHAPFWVYLKGTRIAGLLSGSTMTVEGFTRPTFRARCLIHEMSDGKFYYDRIYGESPSAQVKLQESLINLGYKCTYDSHRGNTVVGSVSEKLCMSTPYFDSLYSSRILKDGIRHIVARR